MIIIIALIEALLGKVVIYGIHHINDGISNKKMVTAYEVVTYSKNKREDLVLTKQIKE